MAEKGEERKGKAQKRKDLQDNDFRDREGI